MASAARAIETYPEPTGRNEATSSGVSWGSVFAGAFAAAALSLILMALGAGMSLSALSPWPNGGASVTKVGAIAIVWLILVQIVASGVGGYIAGRLRTKWVAVHTHEVYFRDTAHGFLVWAVGLVISAFFFASYAGALAGSTNRFNGGEGVEGQAQIAPGNAYFVDMLFRGSREAAQTVAANDATVRAEASRILANSLREPEMPAQDRTYLAQEVAVRTGVSPAAAETRVTQTEAAYREATDMARKAVAHSLYWVFVAMLIGAFCASYAATLGGRQRDHLAI